MSLLKVILPSIHKEGYYFIFIFLIVSVILLFVMKPLGFIGFILTIWCVFFFRDPTRVSPVGDNFIISPADGLVTAIENAKPPAELNMKDMEYTRVSIFLNVFDVHVNRVPASGKIVKLHYNPGKFINASLDKASIYNERQSVLMETARGDQLAFVQIAGLIARRIICNLEEQQEVKAGERFGIIRFGSRMDIYLPKGINPLIIKGQRAIGGETIIADMSSNELERYGEVR